MPSEVLEKENNIILTLVATVNDANSYATLIINLPATAADTTISFSEPIYSGSYEIIDGKGTLTVDSIKVETSEEDSNVEKSISNSK